MTSRFDRWWPWAAAGTGDGRREGGGGRKKCPVNVSLNTNGFSDPSPGGLVGFILGEKREFMASGLNSHSGSWVGWSL